MQITIEIIKVSKPEAKSGKFGVFHQLEVTYKELSNGGKVGGKKLVDFGDSKEVYTAALAWKEGQVISIRNEKIGDFWAWVQILAIAVDEPSPETPKRNAVENTPTVPTNEQVLGITAVSKVTKQQWVPDEVRQRLIVRQSSLERAMQYHALGGGTPTVPEILALAGNFTDWVFEVNQSTPSIENKKPGRPKKIEVEVE